MKYYSEKTVKMIIMDAMKYGMEISQCVPMSVNTYPSIELPDKYGRLIDADEVLNKITNGVYPDSMEYTVAVGIIEREIKEAPIILEATE